MRVMGVVNLKQKEFEIQKNIEGFSFEDSNENNNIGI